MHQKDLSLGGARLCFHVKGCRDSPHPDARAARPHPRETKLLGVYLRLSLYRRILAPCREPADKGVLAVCLFLLLLPHNSQIVCAPPLQCEYATLNHAPSSICRSHSM